MTDKAADQRRGGLRPALRHGPAQPGRIEKAKDTRQALLRLLPYLRPHLPALRIVFLFLLIYTLLDLVGPYLMGVAIDRFIGGSDPSGLAHCSADARVYLLSACFQALADLMAPLLSQRTLQQVRQDLFEHLQSLSLSCQSQPCRRAGGP
jgi:ATP-binding cassette subfamily B protein